MLTYRKAINGDLPVLAELATALAQEQAARAGGTLAEGHQEMIQANLLATLAQPFSFLFLAEKGGQPIGYLAAQLTEPPAMLEAPPYCFISDWYVLPDQRGQGAGKGLLEEVRIWAHLKGVHRFSLVAPIESRAAAIASKAGFGPREVYLLADEE